jgi:hypothetical protein
MLSLVTEKPIWFIVFCLLAAFAYTFIQYKNDKTIASLHKLVKSLLYSFRFLVVFVLSFLLLSPLIKSNTRKIEKPIIVIAQDNSKSISINKDSTFLKNDYLKNLNAAAEKLGEKYEVKWLRFGSKTESNKAIDFSEKQSNISSLFDEIENNYSGRNLGALILGTDGIYNEGTNPFYECSKIEAPVFTIALGDTTLRKDLLISKVLHNEYAYFGNTFPVEIIAEAKQFTNRGIKISISKNDKVIDTKSITCNSSSFITNQRFQLKADEKGVNHYVVQIEKTEGEVTYKNNLFDFFIEVLDGQQKILILANAPHPDIAAIRKSIEKNENYECEVFLADQFNKQLNKYNAIVLHNLPSYNGNQKLIQDIAKSDIPCIFILGTQTNFNAFNNLQTGLSIYPNGNKYNETQAIYNKGFSLFTVDDAFNEITSSFPPLITPFASYKLSNSASALFNQKLGNVASNDPLVVFNSVGNRKYEVICGEGLWQWYLGNYQEKQNHDIFNEFMSKSIQYVASKENKSLFRVSCNNVYEENEDIEFDAELYNESYELINDKEVSMTISNSKGKQFNFAFLSSGNAYQLNAGNLPPDQYTFKAVANNNGKTYNYNGKFIVKALFSELAQTVANHQLLNQISVKTQGKLYYSNQVNQLVDDLMNSEKIKPVVYNEKQLNDAIQLKWIAIMLLCLLSVEWFLRKYFGSY